jgi:nucleoside-diphosphate-sugar epimerase
MRILISGAAGFIGHRLVLRLSPEHDVFGLSRRPSAPAHSIQMDLSAGLDLEALPRQIDVVVHLAQSEHFREFPERADHIYAVNVESTFRLLEYARRAGASRFVLASSGGIYGYAEEALTESAEPRPPDFYLRSKQLAEILLFAYERDLTAIAVRPFFVYGVGQRPTMFIPRLVRNVLLGRPITLSPPDGLLVNPIHVDDAVRAFAASLTADFSGPINIAGPDVFSLGEIARLIGRYLDREPVTERAAAAPGNVVGDITLMSRMLGAPRVTFSDGVVELCREAAAEPAAGGR